FRNLHFPSCTQAYREARYRDQYSSLYVYLTAIRLNRAYRMDPEADASVAETDLTPFLDRLPFRLTEGQMQAVRDIQADLRDRRPMNRLVQGDVGCGKTVVAETAVYSVLKAGGQCAFMAPTEILARQHWKKLSADMEPFGFRTELLVSGLKARERRAILQDLAEGKIDLMIGTHALIQEDVEFRDLRLLITDEQHRFGVSQRRSLTEKGKTPNVLVMSATPIPRTLQATVFGDMDFSVIRTRPASRKKITTRCVPESGRRRAYECVRKELEQGHLAYVVAPSIENNDESGLVSVEQLYEEIRKRFAGFRTGLLHGRMDKEEKERIMQRFASGELQLLVSTVVIEVGIDVPDATVIVIENSDRFGLAQLHQLRGRVGRNDLQSYCYLVNYSKSESAAERMKVMTEISDGFEISEEDFRLRGPGDLMGTMQHGTGTTGQLLTLFRNEELVRAVTQDVEADAELPASQELRRRLLLLSAGDNSNIL
ncbi:MAG: ATP-dependent DNA helicase RecG, partial [Mogibacterium sp.]|nr:ATP-dependent DNA helicase RecG [Mogibacterium sp.]